MFDNDHISPWEWAFVNILRHDVRSLRYCPGFKMNTWSGHCTSKVKTESALSPVRSPLNCHLCGCKTSKLNPFLQTAHFVNLWDMYVDIDKFPDYRGHMNLPHFCVRGGSINIIHADILRNISSNNKDVGINWNVQVLIKPLEFLGWIYPHYTDIGFSGKLLMNEYE